jgi:hypothetical protein
VVAQQDREGQAFAVAGRGVAHQAAGLSPPAGLGRETAFGRSPLESATQAAITGRLSRNARAWGCRSMARSSPTRPRAVARSRRDRPDASCRTKSSGSNPSRCRSSASAAMPAGALPSPFTDDPKRRSSISAWRLRLGLFAIRSISERRARVDARSALRGQRLGDVATRRSRRSP